MNTRAWFAGAAGVLCFFASVGAVHALDRFEIQVYQPDLNAPGQVGLELHSNYTIKGIRSPEYPGEIPPHHVGRLTLEPALGITPWFELGGYFQTLVAPGEGFQYGGVKLRGKFVLPEKYTAPFFLGINVEIGRVPKRVEQDGWANEFRPILGYYDGSILLDVNPIWGYALSGSDKFKPDFEPAGKVGINTQQGFMLGVEYYAGLGLIGEGFSPLKQQEHLIFGTFDLAAPKNNPDEEELELNVAVGRSLTDVTGPQWIAKAIVGKSF